LTFQEFREFVFVLDQRKRRKTLLIPVEPEDGLPQAGGEFSVMRGKLSAVEWFG